MRFTLCIKVLNYENYKIQILNKFGVIQQECYLLNNLIVKNKKYNNVIKQSGGDRITYATPVEIEFTNIIIQLL